MSHHHGLFCDMFGCSTPESTPPPTGRIIQLQPWRDLLLALTDQGDIYSVNINLGRMDLPVTFTLWSRGVPPEEGA